MDHIFINFDKAGSEWVITAYLSGDQNMIRVVESGVSPHIATGSLITGLPQSVVAQEHKLVGDRTAEEEVVEARRPIEDFLSSAMFIPRTMSIRQAAKKGNHGLNYDEGYATFSLINEIPQTEGKKIHYQYRNIAYPGITTWHEWVRNFVRKNGYTVNCFGRRMPFATPYNYETWKKAYASVPQSTNVDLVNRAMVQIHESRLSYCYKAILANQSHDSLLYSYPIETYDNLRDLIIFLVETTTNYMNPTLEYGGREFKIATDIKVGFSWGRSQMIEIDVSSNFDQQRLNLVEGLSSHGSEETKRLADRLSRIC